MAYIHIGDGSFPGGSLGCGPSCACAPCRQNPAHLSEWYVKEDNRGSEPGRTGEWNLSGLCQPASPVSSGARAMRPQGWQQANVVYPGLGQPGAGTLPYRQAMEQTERALFDEYTRACAGVRTLEVLRREPTSLLERVRFWEKVVGWLPKIFELKRLLDERVRAGHMSRADAYATLARQMRHVFPSGYALGTEETELARAHCALAKARWQFFAQQHRGTIPGGGRLLRANP